MIAGIVVSQLNIAGAAPSHDAPAGTSAHIANSDSSTSPRGGELWRGPLGGLRVGGGPVLHGQFTVKTATGTETLDVQTGTVQSVSEKGGQHQVTVKSSDGFSQTYTVTSSTRIGKNGKQATISDLANGDTVRVIATNNHGTLTATIIRDGKLPPQPGKRGPRTSTPTQIPGTPSSGTRT
jgi:hypothetical protein